MLVIYTEFIPTQEVYASFWKNGGLCIDLNKYFEHSVKAVWGPGPATGSRAGGRNDGVTLGRR
jgi:hypothetical protein